MGGNLSGPLSEVGRGQKSVHYPSSMDNVYTSFHCRDEAVSLYGPVVNGNHVAGVAAGGNCSSADLINNNTVTFGQSESTNCFSAGRKSSSFLGSLKRLTLYARLTRRSESTRSGDFTTVNANLSEATSALHVTGLSDSGERGRSLRSNSSTGRHLASSRRLASRIRRVLSFNSSYSIQDESRLRPQSCVEAVGAAMPPDNGDAERRSTSAAGGPLLAPLPGAADVGIDYLKSLQRLNTSFANLHSRSAAPFLPVDPPPPVLRNPELADDLDSTLAKRSQPAQRYFFKAQVPRLPCALNGKRTLLQASTSELLQCLGHYLVMKCPRLFGLQPNEVMFWIKSVDRALIMQGWQEQGFLNPANIVFLYMLVREAVKETLSAESELRAELLTCLYISYSYCGHEISYPLKPFIMELNRARFWCRVIDVTNRLSAKMLRIHCDPAFFTQLFVELKSA